MIREFEGSKSETGFVAIHVAMVRHTGKMVTAVDKILTNLKNKNNNGFISGMKDLREVMEKIQLEMNQMWQESKPEDYDNFRTFIMGTKNQPMFPNGVLYEGVSDKPYFLRGESGANDSIIPTLDNLL